MPLRVIIAKFHKEKGIGMIPGVANQPELAKRFGAIPGDFNANREKYFRLLEHYRPVFAEWFVRNFHDPQSWLMARLAYTRTTAVMSMVGYILGLGDRHCENILMDVCNGDAVHVDLNCLFERGNELKVPEVVPFRLTQNTVQAMGPTGVEGPFRIACEVALKLMRDQKDVLMATLRPFYFDPLSDWVKDPKNKDPRKIVFDKSEKVKEKAVETLKAIENKFNGLVESMSSKKKDKNSINLPLSVPGQVQFLINEAMSHENLSQMFIGWAPYF